MTFIVGAAAGLAASYALTDALTARFGGWAGVWTAPILVTAAGLAMWAHEAIRRKINHRRRAATLGSAPAGR